MNRSKIIINSIKALICITFGLLTAFIILSGTEMIIKIAILTVFLLHFIGESTMLKFISVLLDTEKRYKRQNEVISRLENDVNFIINKMESKND